jgi:hypothetical protein
MTEMVPSESNSESCRLLNIQQSQAHIMRPPTVSPNVGDVQAAVDLLFPRGDNLRDQMDSALGARASKQCGFATDRSTPTAKPYRPTHDKFCRGYKKQDQKNNPETSEGGSLGREAAGGGFLSALIPGKAGLPKGTRNLVLLSLCHF